MKKCFLANIVTQILQLGRHPGKLLAGIMKVSRRVFVRDPGQKLAGMTPWLLAVFLVCSCAPLRKVPAPPPPPSTVEPAPLTLEKTFGEVTFGKIPALLIRYKTISIVIDPGDEAALASTSSQLDYLFLTDASSRRWGSQAQERLRKNIKMIVPPEEVQKIQQRGFGEVKSLSSGQRIMLKKNNDLVFVSASQSRNPLSGLPVNGYLLEFDNGRNLLITGETADENALREFVYTLRDDGKEIYLGFFCSTPGIKPDALARMISLVQPQNAILLPSADTAPIDEASLRAALKDELFNGPLLILKNQTQVPF